MHNIRSDIDILISRPELLQTMEYCFIKWVRWEAPNLLQYNATNFPWNVSGLLIVSVYEAQKAAILVLIQNGV